MQTVKTFRDPWDAHLFRMRLGVDGIPAFVANDLRMERLAYVDGAGRRACAGA